jgi:hypothetical protein
MGVCKVVPVIFYYESLFQLKGQNSSKLTSDMNSFFNILLFYKRVSDLLTVHATSVNILSGKEFS